MKKYQIILIILLIIIVNIISLSFVKKQNKNLEKKSIEINNRLDVIQSQKAIVIENNTFYPINKVMESIVTNILMYDTIYIIIDQIPNSLSFGNTGNSSIRALIYPNMFYKHTYLILLARDIKSDEMNSILLHEAAHIKQYESGDLKILNDAYSVYEYKGDTIQATKVKYSDRPYEKDAFCFEKMYASLLDSLLSK